MTSKSNVAREALETLAELRLSLLAATRQAQETKNAALAKDLKAQAEALKPVLMSMRRQRHEDWAVDARRLQPRLVALTTELARVAKGLSGVNTKAQRAVRFLAAVESVIHGLKGLRP